jgi:hypothetical protein
LHFRNRNAKEEMLIRTTAVFAAALLAAPHVLAQAVPQGWQVIKDNGKGRCQMAVPGDWKQGEILGQKLGAAASPDKSVDAVVNLMDGTSWGDFKSMVFQIYQKEKSAPKIEDSANRMWFEIVSMGDSRRKMQWYVAVPGKAGACNAQVNFRRGDKKAEETARKIVETIRSN